jgi:hypothetical protein
VSPIFWGGHRYSHFYDAGRWSAKSFEKIRAPTSTVVGGGGERAWAYVSFTGAARSSRRFAGQRPSSGSRLDESPHRSWVLDLDPVANPDRSDANHVSVHAEEAAAALCQATPERAVDF